ncbi:MAG: hypothetical protein EBV15_06815 [Bacteroidetes bacterium]|nr:hypothetical protein [Bacteroidota bacterium]
MSSKLLRFGLVGILIISAFIRFWDIDTVPFTYDELSAIFRANSATWNEHWQQGVMPDGHPPGMQTLIWLWVKYFGENAPLMHGVLALFSLASVYFVYKTAETLSEPSKALPVALLYSLSYLPLLWGNQIRPYALGMFFCNAFIWQWSLIWTEKKTSKMAFLLLGLLSAACAWLHYFALLPVLILGLLGFVKPSEHRQKWLLSGFIGLLLFAPALPVFFHQLGFGGLDWLGKPGFDFPVKHLQYLLNGMLYPVLGIFVISVFWRRQALDKNTIKLSLLCFSIFLFPMVFGFVWSWLNKPVLQHNVLLFSTPFFFLGLLSLIPNKKVLFFAPTVALMMGYGLIKSGYFSEGRKNVYQEQAKVFKAHCGQKTLLLADGPEDVLMYHLFKEHDVCIPKFISHSKIPFSYSRLWKQWEEWPFKNNPIILAVNTGSHPGIIPLLEHWTGKEARHRYFIGGEIVYLNNSSEQQTLNYKTAIIKTNQPFEINLKNEGFQTNDLLVIHLADTTLPENTELIGSLHKGNRQIDWRSSKKSEFRGVGDNSLFLFIKTADIPGVSGNTTLSIYLKSEKKGIKTRIEYRLCRANPNMYGPSWFE